MKEVQRCILDTKKISKWGNSTGVLLPKSVLENLDLSVGKEVRFVFEDERIYIENASDEFKIPNFRLEDLMKEYDLEANRSEVEDFQPVGKEIID